MITKNVYHELVKFRDGPIRKPDGPTPMIKHLTALEYIRVIENDVLPEFTIIPVAWELTISGEVTLLEFEQARSKEAKQKSNRSKDRLFQILLVLLGAVLGQLVEHIPDLVDLILDFLSHIA